MRIYIGLLLLLTLAATGAAAQSTAANPDSATFDPDGTAHITRVVPMPATVSSEAQKWLKEIEGDSPHDAILAERRARTDRWQHSQSTEAKRIFPVNVEPQTIAGVRTDIISPLITPAENLKRVLINLHGGGFNSDSGSLIEGIPICNLAKIKVVSVYYRLAPENPFPAAVDDVVAHAADLGPRDFGISHFHLRRYVAGSFADCHQSPGDGIQGLCVRGELFFGQAAEEAAARGDGVKNVLDAKFPFAVR